SGQGRSAEHSGLATEIAVKTFGGLLTDGGHNKAPKRSRSLRRDAEETAWSYQPHLLFSALAGDASLDEGFGPGMIFSSVNCSQGDPSADWSGSGGLAGFQVHTAVILRIDAQQWTQLVEVEPSVPSKAMSNAQRCVEIEMFARVIPGMSTGTQGRNPPSPVEPAIVVHQNLDNGADEDGIQRVKLVCVPVAAAMMGGSTGAIPAWKRLQGREGSQMR